MAFREVTMLEFKEVLRLWLAGVPKKAIARQLGLARNTVRHYIECARGNGIDVGAPQSVLTEQWICGVLARMRGETSRERGESWVACEARRSFISEKLKDGLRLTKVHRLLQRHGTSVPYATLHRFAVAELEFGLGEPSVPVADCAPGQELQVDTGWMTLLEPDVTGRRRRFRAWIFTSVCTRHRFVYATLRETTEGAIEACEAAWRFFGGVFHVIIPDNTKAIVVTADPLAPIITPAFLEYAQARGFQIDTARVRHPKDKARVERTVPTVREDCYRGEKLHTIPEAQRRGEHWSLNEYGMRRHSTTHRLPLEHFDAVEKACLLPAPSEPYDIPKWCSPRVGPDQFAVVLGALYSQRRDMRRKQLRARADSRTVRFYFKNELIETCPRKAKGERYTNRDHFPKERLACAQRDTAFLRRQAAARGKAIGELADALLNVELPWTRMRRVYALLGLCERYGNERVEEASRQAVDAGMHDVRRLERIIKRAMPAAETRPTARSAVIPLARYLRPSTQYALPFSRPGTSTNQGDKEP